MVSTQAQSARQDKTTVRRRAALSVAVVAAFMLLYLGVMHLLAATNSYASSERRGEETVFATEPYYVLLIGSDSRVGTALYTGKAGQHGQMESHSDIMTLVRVDPINYVITLVSVPRDTQLASSDVKINESLALEGPELTVQEVERLCGVEIPYYVMTTFSGFVELVDSLGGVVVDVSMDVTVPDAMTGRDLKVSAGQNQDLNGSEALVFARARKEYAGYQDATRQQNVRSLEKSIIEKVLSYGAQADVVSESEDEDAGAGAGAGAGTRAAAGAGGSQSQGAGSGAESGSGTGTSGADASDASAGADADTAAAAGAAADETEQATLMEYVLSPQLADAIDDLRETTTTNMSVDFLISNIVNFVTHADQVTIYSTTGPYEGDYAADGQWVVPQDFAGWAALMARVDAGEDPSRRYS